jgi:acetate CoA/acetoacetate CoA-transferase alpha subunit
MYMAKLVSYEEAAELIHDGSTVMFGGFLGCGSPHDLIDYLASTDVKDLTIICNDAGTPGGPKGENHYGIAKLIHNHQVKRLIATHVGLNPEVGIQNLQEGTLEVVLVPQGSMAEMIRAGGAGLGAVLTPTGVGTIVEESPLCLGKQTIHGKDYLMMDALRADVAVVAGSRVDAKGNIWYRGNTSNFNTVMATAAGTVIVEAEECVPTGVIQPEDVRTPGIYVDYIVRGGMSRGAF